MLSKAQIINIATKGLSIIGKSIAPLLVAIAGLVITITQFKLYKLEVSPHFNVSTMIGERKEEGKYMDKELHIYNSGGNFYDFDCNIITYLNINVSDKEYLMPLAYFYSANQEIFGSDNGLVFISYGYDSNAAESKIRKMIRESELFKESYVSGKTITYARIKYQDISGNYNTLYFNSNTGKLLGKEQGENLFNNHNFYLRRFNKYKTCPDGGVNSDTITIEVIKEYLDDPIKLHKRAVY